MPTYTTNYHLAKPLVNDPIDEDLWGSELNNDMDIIDSTMKSISDVTGDVAQQKILARKTLSTGTVEECSMSEILDFISSTQGVIVFRGTTGWNALSPGTAGQFLTSGGASADISWSGGTTSFTSSDQTITSTGTLTLAHGLGSEPFNVALFLVCQSSDLGYSSGDVVSVPSGATDGVDHPIGCTARFDAANVYIQYGASNPVFYLNRLSGGGGAGTTGGATNANWKLRVKAWI